MDEDDILRKMREVSRVVQPWQVGLIVLTGGEPFLQVTQRFVESILRVFTQARVWFETNGTVIPEGDGWYLSNPRFGVSMSPKRGTAILWGRVTEVKVVVPGVSSSAARGILGWTVPELRALRERVLARRYWLVPQDDLSGGVDPGFSDFFPLLDEGWRLGVQAHKVWRLK